MSTLLPTERGIPQRLGDFATFPEALDYAARGTNGLNFFDSRGELASTLSFADLRLEAGRLAPRLLGAGLVPGDRVAIVADTHPDVVRAFCASQLAGLVPALLPMPAAFGGREAYVEHIRRLVRASRATALLLPPSLEPWLASLSDEPRLAIVGTLDALAAAEPIAAPVLAAPGPGSLAYLQFSSGSTRFPMGIAVTQAALMANASAILRHGLVVTPEDRAVSWLPLYHDMGLVGFLLAPIAGQVTVDYLAPQDFARRPHLWLKLLSANRGTLSYSPSFGYELCVRRTRTGLAGPLDLSAWRVAGIGGDMIRGAVLARFVETFAPLGFDAGAFVPSYGMAEATLAISFAPLGQGVATDTVDLDRLERDGIAAPASAASERTRSFALCGRPLPGTEFQVRGPFGQKLPERALGRIVVRGPGLMTAYDGRPEESAAVLDADGWLDTGDLGYRLGAQVVITGRAKDLIIVNGRNVWPQDLEWSVEQAMPTLRSGDVAAFSVEAEAAEQVVLLIEARGAPDEAARDRLASEAAGTLRARHGLDARIVLVPPGSLPQTSSGKLARSLARARYLAGAFAGPAAVLATAS